MKKINIGIVGCGRISHKHIEAILYHEDKFNLLSLCDTNKDKLDALSISENIKKYSSLEDMLKNEKLDVVSVCTPSGYHAEQAILASEYKVNVVVEKPISTNYQDALDAVHSCKKNSVKLFVVKQNRYNRTLIELKEAIDKNRFGKIKIEQQ